MKMQIGETKYKIASARGSKEKLQNMECVKDLSIFDKQKDGVRLKRERKCDSKSHG